MSFPLLPNIDFKNVYVSIWRYEDIGLGKISWMKGDLDHSHTNPHHSDFISEIRRIRTKLEEKIMSIGDGLRDINVYELGGKFKNMVLSIGNENKDFVISFPNTEIGYETTMNILSFDVDIEKCYEGETYKEYYSFKVFSMK